MTPEEITALAREYAEENPEIAELRVPYIREYEKMCEDFLCFLLRRFYLVEKAEVIGNKKDTTTNELIEKVTYQYAERHFLDDVQILLNKPWPESKKSYTAMLRNFAETLPDSQWVSVDERLPEINVDVIAFAKYNATIDLVEVAYYDGEDWYTASGEHIRPTHWMKFPAPPKSTQLKNKYGSVR